ncbi:hypothetical protein SLEP1_g46804 [Rubroshorea leprosula]|uniref:Uncharacterized protein n=1 Tax=Rubroshorea leprosula TaxID=152421 RepID=A0AAV5LP58_9ROSI|nr:hypothetical protein SLEP1_g46804 [Rubroshorea leprosula]
MRHTRIKLSPADTTLLRLPHCFILDIFLSYSSFKNENFKLDFQIFNQLSRGIYQYFIDQ